jgi:serine protease Do
VPSLSQTRLSAATTLLLLASCGTHADTLEITSTPSGASVEIDGLEVGTTPYEQNYPGGYFHKTLTSMGARLGHPMIARVSLTGYTTREITLTDGPMSWVSLKGQNHGQYWLLKADHFHVELDSIAATFTGGVTTRLAAEAGPPLSIEDLVQRARPAVVLLKRSDGRFGSGFFVTDTGVIVTNAHVASSDPKLLAVLSNGQELPARVVYLDRAMDIALAKAEAQGLPHLALADAAGVQQGESVVAIGNPGGGLPFSVTKGIVSAVGRFAVAGPGTWIQTDATINPGNSGGPLLNLRGEVVGVNTLKIMGEGVQGIGFALSASDLLEVLRRFYPGITAAAAPQAQQGSGSIEIASVPDTAEIWVDGKFIGNTPSTLKLSTGSHLILLKAEGYSEWQRQVEILKDSKATLTGTLEAIAK